MTFKLFFLFGAVVTLICASSIGKNKFTTRVAYPTKRTSAPIQHGRGEHVINNSVLRVYKDIIDLFLQGRLKITFNDVKARLGRFPESSSIYKDYNQPLSDNIAKNIQTLKAYFPASSRYVDRNADSYGKLIRSLRQSAKLHMIDLYNLATSGRRMDGTRHTSAVKAAILQMNSQQVYVDTMARDYCLNNQGGNKAMYEATRIAVRAMFQNLYDKLGNWIRDIKLARY